MSGVLQDVRYALRQLRKSPGFTVLAVLTLALGIGANTAIFSFMNALLLRHLSVLDPRQLMLFGEGRWAGSTNGLRHGDWQLFSYPMFREFRQRTEVFSDLAAVNSVRFNTHGRVAGGATFEKIDTELVSGSNFNTLGVGALVGRTLTDSDEQVGGAHPVAVA